MRAIETGLGGSSVFLVITLERGLVNRLKARLKADSSCRPHRVGTRTRLGLNYVGSAGALRKNDV
jgi:hypothetical protein